MPAALTLIIACVLFSSQFIFNKNYQLHSGSGLNPALWLAIFNGIWVLLLFLPLNGFRLQFSLPSLLFAAGYAASSLGCIVFTQFAMSRGPMAAVSLFMLTGGLLLPVLYGLLWLGETMTIWKAGGLLLILLSFFPGMIKPGRKNAASKDAAAAEDNSSNLLFWLFCLLIFIGNGMIGIVTKAQSIHPEAVPERDFLILAFSILLLLALFAIWFTRRNKSAASRKEKWLDGIGAGPLPRALLLPVLLAGGYTVCNSVANIFSMFTAKTMDSSLQFPILNAVILLLNALLSRFLYKETISRGTQIGLAMSVAGILLMIF